MEHADIGSIGPSVVMGAFVLFCRIGSCLMVAPGVSNAQIPMQIRLFVAVAITLALSPLLLGRPEFKSITDEPFAMTRLIVMEAFIGALIGLLGRLFFSALESLSVAAATMLGLQNPFGVEMDQQSSPPIATLSVLAATAVIFAADFHWEILRGLVGSYIAIPLRSDFDAQFSMRQIGEVLSQSFLVAIRVASPFFLYSVVVNFSMTLVNRMTPQISIFYIAPPFVACGGIALIYLVIKGQIGQFMDAFDVWLRWG